MPRKPQRSNAPFELRRRAETCVRGQRPKAGDLASPADAQRLFQELEVHQIELELQNAELQKVRDELEIALENYTDLYDFAPMGYLSLDESSVVLEANLTGAALLGLERSQLINRRLQLCLSPADQPGFRAFLKKAFAGINHPPCEAQVMKEGGGTMWASFQATSAISLKGTRKWCRVAFNDITARKLAQETLRASEERFRALFEAGPVAIYSCEASGTIREFNHRAVELWGREPALGNAEERFCGSLKLFRADGHFLPHEQCPMAEVLHGIKPEVRDAEVLVERPDGSRITTIVNIRPLKDERGNITGAINCFYDITDRKHTEETRRRVEVLAASNQKLEKEIVRRRTVEEFLRKSEQHQTGLLKQSHLMQEQLRHLSRQVLRAHEEERKRISRELHDVIAQTLTGINIRLATLNKEAGLNPRSFGRNVARTQQLVEHSVNLVHQFARELRPPVLDDLGLVPALHSFMKIFTARTGVRTRLTAFAGIEQLDTARRTALYRIAQEALTNISRHAKASQAQVNIQKLDGAICMKIKDNGKGFQIAHLSHGKKRKRLGLLGMSERIEMVGGKFTVESTPGKGTTIRALIPIGANSARGGGDGKIGDGIR